MGTCVFLLEEKQLSMHVKASCRKILQRANGLKDVMSWQVGMGESLIWSHEGKTALRAQPY